MVAVNGAFYDVLPQFTQLAHSSAWGPPPVTVQYEKGPELTVLRGIGESEVQPASDEGLPSPLGEKVLTSVLNWLLMAARRSSRRVPK